MIPDNTAGHDLCRIITPMKMESMERNCNIDRLRNLSMLMVVILHVTGFGFLDYDSIPEKRSIYDLLPYSLLWLEILCLCAVNCFAMVSGYLLCESHFRWSRILKLYIQTGFYTISFLLFFLLFERSAVSVNDIVLALVPILDYWYVKAYFGVLLILPALCKLVDFFYPRPKCYFTLLGIICFTTILPGNIWGTETGGCTLWLAILFIVGGVIRKNEGLIKQSKWGKPKWCFLGYFLSAAVIFLICAVYRVIPDSLHKVLPGSDMILMYSSPFVTMEALCLFIGILLGRQDEGKLRRIISGTAPYAFGVYLLHMDPFVRKFILSGCWDRLGLPQSGIASVIPVLGLSFSIFLTGIAVDYLRSLLFSFCRINSLLQKSDRWNIIFPVAENDHIATNS